MTRELLEYVYDTTTEGDMYSDGLSPAEAEEATKYIINTFALQGEPFEKTYKRMMSVCNSIPRELFLYGGELKSDKPCLLDRLKDIYLRAAEELHPDRKEYFINRMLLRIATLNIGAVYKDITEESLTKMSQEDAETTTAVVRITSSARIECLDSFERFITSSISEDMILLDTHADNLIKSDMIDLLTEGYSEEVLLRFNAETCELETFIGDQKIHCYMLGEFYTRYIKNIEKCRNEYALFGEWPEDELLQGMNYDEVYDYLISTGDFDDLRESSDAAMTVVLEPKCLAFAMHGTSVFKKPFGVIFECVTDSIVSQNKEYLIPTMFKVDSLDDIDVKFTTENTILTKSSKSLPDENEDKNIRYINPVIIKSVLKKKPMVLKNTQVSNFFLGNLDGVYVPKVIATVENSEFLENVMSPLP